MAEHDDALLDEDFASLPEISDEEYEGDQSDEDFSTYDRQSNEYINIKIENEYDNVLDLEVLDEFNEFEEELRDVKLNNSLKNNNNLLYNQQKFDENNNQDDKSTIYHNYNVQSHSSDSDIATPKCDLRLKLHNLYRQREVNNINDINDEDKPTIIRIQNDNNLIPYLNRTTESIGSIRRKYDMFEPNRCSFMENQSLSNLTNFSDPQMMNECCSNFQTAENFNPHVMSISNSVPRSFDDEPIYKFLPDQSQFSHNQNVCGNYTMHHLQVQTPSFPVNQNFSVHPTFQVHQILSANQTLPFMSNMAGVMPNSNMDQNMLSSTIPNYPQPTFSYQSDGCTNAPQYTVNPFNFNGHKILVNRDFRKSQTGREVKILHNDVEYNEFPRINSSFPIDYKNLKSNQYTKNYDPYSYFSDVWQEKKSKKNEAKSFSTEIIFSNTKDFNINKNKLGKQYDKKDFEMNIIIKDETMQKNKVSLSNRNDNDNLKNIKKSRGLQKRKNKKIQNQTLDRSNNCNKVNTLVKKSNFNHSLKKEAELDPQMKEYCRKVEEQKLLREKLLLQKENRRKKLAMEKLGIKKEPFSDPIDLEIQEIIDMETKCQQEVKSIKSSSIIELNK